MKTKLKNLIHKTAKIMLLLLFLTSCSPYRYAYKARKSELKALQADKAWERSAVKQ